MLLKKMLYGGQVRITNVKIKYMKCDDFGPLDPCGYNRHFPSIKHAGENVGIDLEKPIDLSQMRVNNISHYLHDVATSFKLEIVRETELETYVINEFGERELLIITFTLRSQRQAKFTEISEE